MADTSQTRGILSEIPDRGDRPRLAETPTRMLAEEPTPANVLHNTFGSDPLGYLQPSIPSPDEIIIRQRGRRRRVKLNWSPDKCPVPSRCPFQKTPTKTSTPMTLRSSPRKRLLDGLNFQTTPEKASRPSPLKITPDSNLRTPRTLTTPLLKRLMLDEVNSTPHIKRMRFEAGSSEKNQSPNEAIHQDPHHKIKSSLNLMSHKQLVNMILDMMKESPQVEALVTKTAPKPDLSGFCDDLKDNIRQIHRCLPKSSTRCSSTSVYPRVSAHIKEFKETLLSQCTRLYKANQWELILEYHRIAWPIVRSLPVWDNAKYDSGRTQCFKFLCSMVSIALKRNGEHFDQTKLEELQRMLQVEVIDSRDVLPVIDEVKRVLREVV